LPELKELTISGIRDGKKEDIIKENDLVPGQKVTENLIATTRNYLTNKYQKQGFLNTKVNIVTSQVIDSVEKERVDMLIKIDRGEKLKLKKSLLRVTKR
jgi:outer membrane protein insertion porin family